MGRLIDGKWVTEKELEDTIESGEFKREDTVFRDWVRSDGSGEYEPGVGRYHLYISRACPWAHRTTIMRRLKGLEDAISMSVVEPVRIDDGWEFSEEYPDHLYNSQFLRQIYQKSDPDANTRVTVPVLWDKQTETIVNNESREIMRMLDTEFDTIAKNDISLVPDALYEQVEETLDAIYEPINNGVYRSGFASMQRAHERAVRELFEALDHWENVLDNQRFLCGDRLTEADIAMFTTLYRFDNVYHVHFKCNVRRITDYPNLWNYLKELYQIPAFQATCNMNHIKRHYYKSHTWLNPKQIVPVGPEINFDSDHNRDRLSAENLAVKEI
jgi:putative glutathione S-transferase